MSGIQFENIRKSFGATPVLRDVSLSIKDGEFLTLLGPSGCGKSTLLRILAGLEYQDAGSLYIGDQRIRGLRASERDVAMVFQSYALYPHMTVAANISVPLRMRRLSLWQRLPVVRWFIPKTSDAIKAINSEVEVTATSLGIGHLLRRKPGQLSGGQRQRVAVARAMVRKPTVFLMDEPLSNLDAKLRVQMRTEIKELHRRLGVTFIYVTHDQAEAMTLSDRVAVMLDGEVQQVAPPADIYAKPINRRVAEFVGSPKINILEGVVREGGILDVAAGRLGVFVDAPVGSRIAAGIRPEDFSFTERLSKLNTISGLVHLVEHMGSDLFVHLTLQGSIDPLIVRLPPNRAARAAIGSALIVEINPANIVLFDASGARLQSNPITLERACMVRRTE